MRIEAGLSDEAILGELGGRLREARLRRNLTQSQLAAEAGVTTATVSNVERGRGAQLTSLIRIMRCLDLVESLEGLLPAPTASPLDEIDRPGHRRQRARPPTGPADRTPTGTSTDTDTPPRTWKWGDEK